MLCDQFAEFPSWPRYELNPEIHREAVKIVGDMVAKAPRRYILDRPATMMVHSLSTMKPSQFLNAMHICRLPMPRIWVEFEFKHRTEWLEEASRRGAFGIESHPLSAPPERLGFLMEEFQGENGRTISIQPVWATKGDSFEIAMKKLLVFADPEYTPSPECVAGVAEFYRKNPTAFDKMPYLKNKAEFEQAMQLEARLEPVIPSYWQPLWDTLKSRPDLMAFTERTAYYDLMAEWRFALGLLIIMNSWNMAAYGDEQSFEKLNKKRAKGNQPKPPLLSHQVITLNLSKVQKRRLVAHSLGTRRSPDEPFWVVGHLKVRKTGVYWWSPHERNADGEHEPKPQTIRVTA